MSKSQQKTEKDVEKSAPPELAKEVLMAVEVVPVPQFPPPPPAPTKKSKKQRGAVIEKPVKLKNTSLSDTQKTVDIRDISNESILSFFLQVSFFCEIYLNN